MRRLLVLIFSISVLSFSDESPSSKQSNYFEGQVTYTIDYAPYNKTLSPERIKELVGSKMILTFKKGNYKKEYFSPNGELLQTRILNLRDKKSYMKTKDSDTIYLIDITKNESKTTFEVLSDSTILKHPCTIIKTQTMMSGESVDGKPIEIGGLFKYAKDLPVNPDWYTNYKEGNFNEIVKSGKGIAIVTINKGMYWEQEIRMSSITKRKVKNSELKMKRNRKTPLKEL